jgi:hypothetical protein
MRCLALVSLALSYALVSSIRVVVRLCYERAWVYLEESYAILV